MLEILRGPLCYYYYVLEYNSIFRLTFSLIWQLQRYFEQFLQKERKLCAKFELLNIPPDSGLSFHLFLLGDHLKMSFWQFLLHLKFKILHLQNSGIYFRFPCFFRLFYFYFSIFLFLFPFSPNPCKFQFMFPKGMLSKECIQRINAIT